MLGAELAIAVKRYELNEMQCARLAPLLPGKAGDPGRTGSNNRLFVNGCLWVPRSGAHWCDLPECHGRWTSVHRRFSRWCHAGVWEQAFRALTADAALGDLGIVYLFEDWLAPHVDTGALVVVLDAWCESFDGPRLYFAKRAVVPRPLRLFLDP